jgi:hypothetical protein
MGYIKKDKDKIQAAEIFLRRVKGCTRADRIRNVDIRAELNIYITSIID